jgi:hypothetical protein
MKRTNTFRSLISRTLTGKALLMALAALITITTVTYAAQGRRGPKVKSITVEAAASGAKAITAFSFANPAAVTVTINETTHTIALTVPYGTAVTSLVSTFTASAGASVKVGTTAQTSGTTANDFTSAVTYTVTAEDNSTQDYAVTVTVNALAVGDSYGGGIVVYINPVGDSAKGNIQASTAATPHGLIAATADQSSSTWSNITNVAVTGTGTAIGTGAANTEAITGQTSHSSSAAQICADYSVTVGGVTYSDWYLPSKDELEKLYLNKTAVGGFAAADYWSSSETSAYYAWSQYFVSGAQYLANFKFSNFRVRAVRAF